MAKFNVNFISTTLKRAVDITVVIPSVTFPEACGDGNVKGVIPRHRKEEKYPVLYLLHGIGNDHGERKGEKCPEYRTLGQIVFLHLHHLTDIIALFP